MLGTEERLNRGREGGKLEACVWFGENEEK